MINLFQFAVDMATEKFATATPQEREELARDVAIDDVLRQTMLRVTKRLWEDARFSVLEYIAIRKTIGVPTGRIRHPRLGDDGWAASATLEQKAATLILIEEMSLSVLTLKMSAQ